MTLYETKREERIPQKIPRIHGRPILLGFALVAWVLFIRAALEPLGAMADNSMVLWCLTALALTLVGLCAPQQPDNTDIIIGEDGIQCGAGSQKRFVSWPEVTHWRWSDPMTEKLFQRLPDLPPDVDILVDHTPAAANPEGWVLVIQPETGNEISIWAKDCTNPAKAEASLRSALVCNCPHEVIRDPRRGIIHVHRQESPV